ncbi:MAG: PIN domain-containing protein [Verrucomicrobia bacterium]|nr:MAG: PIN domain-containing protein [Verrucomicrobiota bacterium]
MIALLDINVLIALVDTGHVHHASAKRFFISAQPHGWATCPIIENGFLRILGRSKGVYGPDSPTAARILLLSLLALPGHQFWPDDASLTDTRIFRSLPSSKQLTDLYLLGLAVQHGGRFATFDQGIDASLIPGGPAACFFIPPL